MLVKINTVVEGDVIKTRSESFSRALILANQYATHSREGIQLVDDNDLNKGWYVDVPADNPNVTTTYDFQPVMD